MLGVEQETNLSSFPSLRKPLQPPVTVQIFPSSSHSANSSNVQSLRKSLQPPVTSSLSDPNILITVLNGC